MADWHVPARAIAKKQLRPAKAVHLSCQFRFALNPTGRTPAFFLGSTLATTVGAAVEHSEPLLSLRLPTVWGRIGVPSTSTNSVVQYLGSRGQFPAPPPSRWRPTWRLSRTCARRSQLPLGSRARVGAESSRSVRVRAAPRRGSLALSVTTLTDLPTMLLSAESPLLSNIDPLVYPRPTEWTGRTSDPDVVNHVSGVSASRPSTTPSR